MSFASRWVAVRRFAVNATDLDSDGVVRAESIDRWLAQTRSAYLERCVVFRDLQVGSAWSCEPVSTARPARERFGRPTAVIVGAGATEIRPTSFTIAFRLRPADGDGDDAINAAARCRSRTPPPARRASWAPTSATS